ncbi:MAG TPA: hypothetical protein PKG50_06235 [Candidatus Bipolaricaulis anaerobius]|jgi:hypothetical protein|uniref:Uncharacterized protein n=1 Tax=Candidatus Bipolaricaulis anaerobius TaxID=2026885 RepID=A0A2X3MK80_9BACT|nr:hypothetical protein [Candidatus Bipolaricaulis anaerobius]MDD2912058.1 hypothetical protein [Candidatus Bipolaricaulis anaerobius]MDD3748281.1 hypothetical protein [Candidatus Bipolaricaulis anaerobius]MDD5763954.1 hypothetical protein [Candidatus Bipolaricaulis anaerobius]SQD92545.1 conserved protein of unknown function [Candidatus Bipolaricaulis anaerobius]HNR24999.1 hypothetical protein [Candidatus Bipolaricaulis anaerobius]
MGWRERLQREYLEADREFVEEVLPLGTVDASAFGLIADATRYVLVREGGEVHIRPEIASLDEVLRSLAQAGSAVARDDARAAVIRFASLWEGKARARGRWDETVGTAEAAGEVTAVERRQDEKPFWKRLFRG